MKNKIILFLIGCLFIIACSEDFITKDFDKTRYNPETFYNNKEHALLGLNACYFNSLKYSTLGKYSRPDAQCLER